MVVLFVLLNSSGYALDHQLLDQAITEHKTTVARLNPFAAKVELTFQNRNRPVERYSSTVWRDGTSMRIKQTVGSVMNDILVVDGRTRLFSKDSRRTDEWAQEGLISTAERPVISEPWGYALLSCPGNVKFAVELEELLRDKSTTVNRCERVLKADGNRILIDAEHSRGKMQLYLNPAKHYLIDELELTLPDSINLMKVESFHSVGEGQFFPARVTCTTRDGTSGWVATFSEVVVNRATPERIFDLRFPAGILVIDETRGDIFRTDASGNPTLPAKNANGKRLTLSTTPPVPSAEPGGRNSSYTLDESQGFPYRELIIVSLLAIVVGVSLKSVFRRRRIEGS